MSALAPRADVAMLALGLERIGWSVLDVEIDLRGEGLRVFARFRRFDGRLVEGVADDRGGRIDRFESRPTAQRWRGEPCVGRDDVFIGRMRTDGPRAMLRTLTRYLADNPPDGFARIAPADVRRLFAPLMTAP